jgi:hypothetical protein
MGAKLDRILFLRAPGRHSIWAAEQVLRSGTFSAVALIEPCAMDRPALRRLQLAAERSRALTLLVSSRRELPLEFLEARVRLEPISHLQEMQDHHDISLFADPPRQCRTVVNRRGSGTPLTVDVILSRRVLSREEAPIR